MRPTAALAVLDDEFGDNDRYSATYRTAQGAPTPAAPVDPGTGMCRVDAVLVWPSRQ